MKRAIYVMIFSLTVLGCNNSYDVKSVTHSQDSIHLSSENHDSLQTNTTNQITGVALMNQSNETAFFLLDSVEFKIEPSEANDYRIQKETVIFRFQKQPQEWILDRSSRYIITKDASTAWKIEVAD